MKRLHCFLVPLHNEELVISKTLASFKKAGVAWEDIYLVDDGSTDQTIEALNKASFPYLSMSNVLCLQPNVGKTQALVSGFKHFKLAKKYEFVNTCDGDTLLASDYLTKLVPILNDIPHSTAAIASRVCSIRNSWNPYTSYRTYEYALMQQTYKRAQGHINCITVLPGCGTTVRTEVFEKLSKEVRPEMLTEDMLWTIWIHAKKLGRILYAHSLRVFTQDPDRMSSYWKQNTRWFSGGWQVYREQKMWQVFKNKINAETSFLLLEGLFFSMLFLFAFVAAAFKILPNFVHYFFFWDLIIFVALTLFFATLELDIRVAVWMPFFYLLRIVKCIIYLNSFVKIVLLKSDKKKKLQWNKVKRY
jgi:cellulose synthase/poly-beta-1,6-N-acetylglucosamine synthase-like glycosyltransferase